MRFVAVLLLACALGPGAQARRAPDARVAGQEPSAPASRERESPTGDRHAVPRGFPLVAAQVLLDRAGFSPGEIDGQHGRNTTRALEAFQRAQGLAVTGDADRATMDALAAGDSRPVLVDYTLSEADLAGPFLPVPEDLTEQAALPALGYASAMEQLGERVHASPELLRALNPSASFAAAGETVRVPNAGEALAGGPVGTSGRTIPEGRGPVPAASEQDVVVRVSKSAGTLTVIGGDGRLLQHAPVTVGSEHDPLPVGEWEVTLVKRNPIFNYNPELFWDADPSHAKAVLPPGPNNPVGTVWIGINREHYGLHGTPEPGRVGHVASHGCVRLTNWDASRLASFVGRGTRVVFEE